MKNRSLWPSCLLVIPALLSCVSNIAISKTPELEKTRVIITSDGEVDDECSLVRFLLYANEWDIEGIITSSSQYHWQGHKWAGDDWAQPVLNAYAKVHGNLIKHDPHYPSAEFLQKRTLLGNVKAEGEMDEVTPGSERIVEVLLDESDNRPVWLQAWGGTNTIARALKTIEQEHPDKMAYVANKIRFYFIWEQDTTYQDYILPHWGKYQILTIISDQFWALAYQWKKILPAELQKYFAAPWMNEHILQNHGPLMASYKAHTKTSYGLMGDYDFSPGDFRSEGDSPAFLHTISTGLRSMESPDWGGWGGRYINVHDNTWLDPVPVEDYTYPKGRWYTSSAWGRMSMREGTKTTEAQRTEYFKPMWRWSVALQNDFAARADWSIKSFAEANHPPVVELAHEQDIYATPGTVIKLDAKGSHDPDGDPLTYQWWQYQEADTYAGTISIKNADQQQASFVVPKDAPKGQTIHVVAEVKDKGEPALTRYRRVVIKIE
ncbi:nucleoside hydrolase-like domain-containing protein [Paraglaciecola hydrolytica]|uniref:DUF1593 domain-containing protein n=1 Tax=Paraglaciecola hydrolytica TaxID=1799789 RepID=A0A148KKW0_9ALTE|nr:nucleoside hydrolase-like domain-containing protein [Paraglaciecola hydrolytica]KXI26909.1 hypothetical protein AX660_03075 [Paraglaciecola hydrolytica]